MTAGEKIAWIRERVGSAGRVSASGRNEKREEVEEAEDNSRRLRRAMISNIMAS